MRIFTYTAAFLLIVTDLAQACPYCLGQGGTSYLEKILLPILGLLLAPILVFFVLVMILRKRIRKENANG